MFFIFLFLLVNIDDEIVYNKSTEFVTKQAKIVSFPGYHDATVTLTGDIYVVDSPVIVSNKNGIVKKYYRCILSKDSEEWKCHSVDIYDHPF